MKIRNIIHDIKINVRPRMNMVQYIICYYQYFYLQISAMRNRSLSVSKTNNPPNQRTIQRRLNYSLISSNSQHGNAFNNKSYSKISLTSSYSKPNLKNYISSSASQINKNKYIRSRIYCQKPSTKHQRNRIRNYDSVPIHSISIDSPMTTVMSEKQSLRKKLKSHYQSFSICESEMREDEVMSNWGQSRKKQKKSTRLEQIMNIKVEKPQVCSTLKDYKPLKKVNEISQQKVHENQEKLRWQVALMKCKKQLDRKQFQQEKENMLWKTFERDRQLRYKEKIKQLEKKERNKRRCETRFEKAIEKQLKRIQQNKSKVFS